MERDLTKEEVQAQIEAKKRDLSEHARVLEHEAEFMKQLATERMNEWRDTAEDNMTLIGGGLAALVGLPLLAKLFSGSSDSGGSAPTRTLDDRYVNRLAGIIEHRISGGDHMTLRDALAEFLADEG